MKNRTILHCDCNSFYASVECVLNPKLKEVPMAVGGDPESRHGIILAKNEIAKKYGIQTAETIFQAKKKCPELVIVPPQHEVYNDYSGRVKRIYLRYTEFVESFGLDEAWLDVTSCKRLFGSGKEIADNLRRIVREETGLTISVGVSFCKVFAKLGSDYKKPDATTVFSHENWKQYIFLLPVSTLLYVGKHTQKKLFDLGIKTIGELAAAPRELLAAQLGKAGEMLHIYANGLDNEPVKSIYEKEEVKSIGNSTTFSKDITGEDEIKKGVYALSDSIAERMRRKGLKCTTVQIQIKNPDFKVISRQKKTEKPTYIAREIRKTAMEIIHESWNMKQPIRMISVTGANLIKENEVSEQISLFDEPDGKREKTERLEKTMDILRKKFGDDIIKR